MSKTTLIIDEELKGKLKAIAEEQNRSTHNLIITILKEYVKAYKK